MRKIALLAATLVLAACATTSQDQCLETTICP